jgi:hypothetical protein
VLLWRVKRVKATSYFVQHRQGWSSTHAHGVCTVFMVGKLQMYTPDTYVHIYIYVILLAVGGCQPRNGAWQSKHAHIHTHAHINTHTHTHTQTRAHPVLSRACCSSNGDMQHVIDSFYSFNHQCVLEQGPDPHNLAPSGSGSSNDPLRVILRAMSFKVGG